MGWVFNPLCPLGSVNQRRAVPSASTVVGSPWSWINQACPLGPEEPGASGVQVMAFIRADVSRLHWTIRNSPELVRARRNMLPLISAASMRVSSSSKSQDCCTCPSPLIHSMRSAQPTAMSADVDSPWPARLRNRRPSDWGAEWRCSGPCERAWGCCWSRPSLNMVGMAHQDAFLAIKVHDRQN